MTSLRIVAALAAAGLLGAAALSFSFVLGSAAVRADFDVQLDHTRPLPQGDFYVGPFPEPEHLNPFTTSDAVALSYVLRSTHDCLMQCDLDTGELQPALAQLESASADGLEAVFRLREGVLFADGTPVGIDDVAFTFEVVRDRTVPAGSIHDAVARISRFERLDDRRFRIELRERHFTGIAGVATGYRVVKKAWFLLQVAERARALGREPPVGPGRAGFGELLAAVRLPGPGTGPYQIAVDRTGRVTWRDNQDLWLVQNPQSWHRAAWPRLHNLAGMRLRFLTDQAAQFAELQRRGIDWYLATDPRALLESNPELQEDYRLIEYDSLKLGQCFVLWNHAAGRPTADPDVRRALTMLFDREGIVRELFGGRVRVAAAWFKPGTPEYGDAQPLPFDPQQGKALLAKAGFGRDRPLRLEVVAPDDQRYRRILEFVARELAAAHVELDAQLAEWTAVTERREQGDFDGLMMMWSHDILGIDPHEFFHSNPAGAPDGHNWMRYHSEEVDRLLETARVEMDRDARAALYRQFNELLRRDQPITLLYHPTNSLLLHKRFREVAPGKTGVVSAKWWVPRDEQLHRLPGR